MNGQVVFILWRESVEALLVVGILSGWLRHQDASRRAAWFLWGGVVAGFALAVFFALIVLGFSDLLTTATRKVMMTMMVFIASGLIVQMVAWMRAHGRTLKRDIERNLSAADSQRQWWAIFVLAALAVAREGSETVVFLYGTLAAAKDAALGGAVASASFGLFLAVVTFWALQVSGRYLPWRSFFRISEAMLLLLGCALFISGIDALVSQGVLPYTSALWDTSWLLDDSTRFGGLLAGLTGYRSAPDVSIFVGWLVYWFVVLGLLHVQRRVLQHRAA
jgi:high-affinity iron transporter